MTMLTRTSTPPAESAPEAAYSAETVGGGTLVRVGAASVVVPYSKGFIAQLSRLRAGVDLIDELLRSEHGPYLHARLAQLLEGIPDRDAVRLLDFGAGAGGSAVVLARLGFRNIVGIDIVPDYAPIWRQRLDEAGFKGVGTFQVVEENRPFPMSNHSFDLILLNGVLEHLLPEERRFVLEEARRVLRTGGLLAIAETPNRWFPRNSHTKLWLSEFLPASLAASAAVAFGIRRDFPRKGRVAQYRTGYRGMSVGQIDRILQPTMGPRHTPTALARDEFLLPRNPLQSANGRSRAGSMLWRIVAALAVATGKPPAHLAPHLNLLYEKL